MPMRKHEDRAIEIAERVSSVFSVLGAFFIITTFIFNYRFRKPINRLVFYASWGNLFANVATLISRSGIKIGVDAPLCQFQGFLIQWFVPADALWTFSMALNVFLTFFRQYDAASLRSLEWRYLVLCYGIPFIPALIYCFIDTAERGKFYGSANLWCWVSTNWKVFRMVTCYGPIWVVITMNVIIYIKVGAVVLKWRRQHISLKRTPSSALDHAQPSPAITVPMRDMGSPVPAALTNSYELSIVSQVPHYPPNRSPHISIQSPITPTPTHHRFPSSQSTTIQEQAHVQRRTTIVHPASIAGTYRVVDVNKATVSYCYTALLFFLVLLVTWVPSTVNRLYTLIKPNSSTPFALDFASGLVLPLQGFWNTVIYVVTSLPACKALFTDFRHHFSRRSNSTTAFRDSSRPAPGIKRYAAQVGSDDTTFRCSEVMTPKWGHESKSSHTFTEAIKSPTKRESRESMGGGGMKNRADIVISFDGKKRVVHDRRESGPGDPFENLGKDQWKREEREWVPPKNLEEGGGQTRLYESVGGSWVGLGGGDGDGDDEGGSTASDESEMEKGRERMRIGMAR